MKVELIVAAWRSGTQIDSNVDRGVRGAPRHLFLEVHTRIDLVEMVSLAWCLVVLSCVRSSTVMAVSPHQPNVVLLMADDQGWGDVGYNAAQYTRENQWTPNAPRTPSLDAMAQSESTIVFHRFYVRTRIFWLPHSFGNTLPLCRHALCTCETPCCRARDSSQNVRARN